MNNWRTRFLGIWLLLAVILAAGCEQQVAEPPAAQEEPAGPQDLRAEMESQFGTAWFGVYFQGDQKSGYARITVGEGEFDDQPAYVTSMAMNARMQMLGVEQPMDIAQDRYYALTGELLGLEMTTRTVMGKGEFSGKVEGDELVIESTLGGDTRTRRYPKPDESLESVLAAFRLLREGGPGESVQYEVFDVMAQGPVRMTTRLTGFETRLIDGVETRIGVFETTYQGMGVTSTEYVTETGELLETTVAQMFTLRREPEKVARDVRHSFDVLRASIIEIDRDLGDAANVRSLKLELSGIPAGIELVEDDRQKIERTGEEGPDARYAVSLTRATTPDRPPTLPMDVDDPEIARWLEPSTFAQSDHPDIQKLAAEIVGETTDSFAAARRIQQWVYDNLRKEALAAIPNAVDVMNQRRGACTEHSILFVALARAAGIPTRQVVGIGYSRPMGGFGYHAWVEVWAGQWVAMDPTWGENLAGATHVKFGIGDTESMGVVAGLVGSLEIKVLELETD